MTSQELSKLIALNLNLGFSKSSVGTTSIFLKEKFEIGEFVVAVPFIRYSGTFNFRRGLFAYVAFNQVETILKKLYTKHRIEYSNFTIYKKFQLPAEAELIDIHNQNGVLEIIPLLQNAISNNALPFFEMNKNINSILSTIETMDKNELYNYVYTPHLIKILILLKIANSPKYNSYKIEVEEIYRSGSTGKYSGSYLPIFEMLPELFEELDRI